ncbi:hypothetical protein GC169_09005 [bacterium]|nr:hypothetical protein [bacterium]
MTRSPSIEDASFGFGRMIGGIKSFIVRAGFAAIVMFAVVVALLATTFIGVAIAVVALVLGLAHALTFRGRRPAQGLDKGADRGEVPGVLNARQTPDGWVVESGGAGRR